VAPGFTVRLHAAGHILGAACVELRCDGVTLLFSGDLGRPDDLILLPPAAPPACDLVVMESTYGDRLHEASGVRAQLAAVICRTVARGGSVLLPAFAVGRSQTLLYLLSQLRAAGEIPDVPVYLNSPMAVDMTEIYLRHQREHRLLPAEVGAMQRLVRYVRSTEESRALNERHEPAVIVSASGMATGGRVLYHLKSLAPDARNAIVFAGYQAGGTRGARLVAGERQVRIFGQEVAVNAEVVALPGLSAHADAAQLVAWLGRMPSPPQRVFLTHGEPEPAAQLRQRVESALGWPVTIPGQGDVVEFPPAVAV
jgi:metallo-beta-lactamase family protein